MTNDFYTKLFSVGSLDTDKRIRAAMIELNKIGGAIVLDCLTEKEIAAIMIAHVEKIFTYTDGKFTITEY